LKTSITSGKDLRRGWRRSVSQWICPALPFIAGFLALLASLSGLPYTRGQADSPSEYQLKAAFLFNFAKFIDWPPGNSQSPFAICVLGNDPFGNDLNDDLQGKMIGNQHLEIRRFKDKLEARRCRMVFVSSSESAHLADIFESLRGGNVLTVGDTSGFAEAGGVIEFTLEDSRVRFTINTDAANRSGLTFSSKLLALAKLVHDAGHSKGD
jgi:hypothetical protein